MISDWATFRRLLLQVQWVLAARLHLITFFKPPLTPTTLLRTPPTLALSPAEMSSCGFESWLSRSDWSFLKSGVPRPVTLADRCQLRVKGTQEGALRIPSLRSRETIAAASKRRPLGDVVQALAACLVKPGVQEPQYRFALRKAVVVQERDDGAEGRGGRGSTADCTLPSARCHVEPESLSTHRA